LYETIICKIIKLFCFLFLALSNTLVYTRIITLNNTEVSRRQKAAQDPRRKNAESRRQQNAALR
jgi:hypothetical protein